VRWFGIRRFALRVIAAVCVLWTLAAPVAARALYPPKQQAQPHGATEVLFYCHLL
jgi:hypothetical protein